MRRVFVFAALALLLVSPAAFGQAQRGSIEVTVRDSDGKAIPGAAVSAESDQTLTRRSAVTNVAGEAELVALDPATNYVVTVELDGFATQTIQQVIIKAGVRQSLEVQLSLAEVAEILNVTAESPLVDVTNTQAGQDITLQLTEALPSARSYQDYLQLVPGVQDTLGVDGFVNPASRSGVNYRDAHRDGGDVTFSTDNLYYFDGINVTDRTTGGSGADLNTEIIQEQSVLTGAIPAEFVGAPGLISNVVTKSGGNQFSGSVNYYFQNDSLVEDNKHFPNDTFSTFDAAATLGGPIWRDKAWFFASLRQTELERDVVDEQGTFLRTPKLTADQAFGKVTWALTGSDVFSATWMDDPRDQSGSFDRTVPNNADESFERGGERYSIGYNRVWGSAALELAATDHEADLNEFAAQRENANTVSFAPGVPFTSAEESLGGAGEDEFINRGTEAVRGSFEYLFDTGWGDHALKFGVVDDESVLFEDETFTGSPPAVFTSLSPMGAGGGPIRLCAIVGDPACGSGDPWSTVDFGASTDETLGFVEGLNSAQLATLVGLWDDNGNGVLDGLEIIFNMSFGSTAGNPNGLINYTRDLQTTPGVSKKGSKSTHYYIQDSWQWNKWSVNAGLRAEDTTFLTDAGDDVGTWDTEVAPRLSIAYDIKGDGRSSIGVFYGEYYDAFRDNAIDFAGTLTGRVIEEQVYVDPLGEWINFRFRGGTTVQDAFFAPRIETPVTEEIQIQYKKDLGRNMMIEVNLIDRETTNIGEDYGRIYYDIDQYITDGQGDPNVADTLFLGPQFFGFPDLAAIDQVRLNFMIGTLPPEAFRDWQGIELIFRKRYSDNWQMLASYNYADGEGNTNSDANFDGAGDVFPLDPRAPNRTGTQPGLVEHLFKVHGSYNWDNGFQVGAGYRWNSGIILNRNQGQAFGRSLPAFTDTPFPARGLPGTGGLFGSTWIADDAIGFIDGKSYGVASVRGAYIWSLGDRTEVDIFVDIFNIFDDQAVIRVQDLESGGEGFDFLEGVNFVEPRRYFLGARLRF